MFAKVWLYRLPCALFALLASIQPFSTVLAAEARQDQLPLNSELIPILPEDSDWSARELQLQLNQLKSYASQPKVAFGLQQALDRAIHASPQLAIAYRSIQEQQWELIAARRRWYPQLMLSAQPLVGFSSSSTLNYFNDVPRSEASVVPFASDFTAETSSGVPLAGAMRGDFLLESQQQPSFTGVYSNGLEVSPTASLSWSFFDLSRDSDINSQSELLRQQELLFDVTSRSLILQVEQSYYMLQAFHRLIEAYIRLSEQNIREVFVMEQRLKIRLATVADVEQSKSQALNQMNQLIQNLFQYAQASATLAQLMALKTDQQIFPVDPFDASLRWPLSLQETIALGLKQREEIYASLAESSSFAWEARSLMQQYIPTFFLFGTGSFNFNQGILNRPLSGVSSSGTSGTLRNPSSAVGLGLSWNIFDGGIRAAQSSARKIQSQQQREQADQNRFVVVEQIKTAYAGYQTQYQALLNSDAAVKSALKAQEAARARYQVGIGDITSLVQATSLYGQALTNQANAQMQYSTAIASLFRFSAVWPFDSERMIAEREEDLQ